MSLKIDLHVHSVGSQDSLLTFKSIQNALESRKLDVVAITDHDDISFAQQAQKTIGNKIIIGEEINTLQGEIIGLYLTTKIAPGQSLSKTVEQIKLQGGLVYVPHPFENVRKGISYQDLLSIVDKIDLIEIFNGRAMIGNQTKLAQKFANQYHLVGVASSDAHGQRGWGRTYTLIQSNPNQKNLVQLINDGTIHSQRPTLCALMYPKFSRLKRKVSS